MRTVRLMLIGMLLAFATAGWAQTARWTFMVYMAADNDLEPFGIADFNEMETVGSSTDLQIIVQFDRAPQYDETNGNWTDTRRFRVTKDFNTSTISSAVVQNLGEVNMGDPASLVDFVSWAKQSYPAERYCLVLWDHGGGWKRARLAGNGLHAVPAASLQGGTRLRDLLRAGDARPTGRPPAFKDPFRSGWGPGKDVCVDETNSDRLLSNEIASALQSIPGTIDVLGFDACLMAMIENAYEIRGKVGCMAGSEETEPGDGWAYDLVLDGLNGNPTMSGAELGALLVEKYQQYYGSISGSDQTFSTVDLSKLDGAISAINDFCQAILAANPWPQVDQARQESDGYNERQHIDLYDFADRLGNVAAAVSMQAAMVKSALTNMVIANYAEPSHAGAHGLAVYFPPSSGYDPRYANGVLNLDFTASTQWDEMIQASYSGGGGTGATDPYEPNDTYAQAYGPVTSGFTYDGYLAGRTDADIYKIVGGSTFNLRVDMTVPADYDIYLVRKNGDQYVRIDSSLNYNLDPELIQRSDLPAGEYYVRVVYLLPDNNVSSNPYHLTMTQSGGGGVVDLVLQYDDDDPGFGVYSNRWDFSEGVACYFIPPVTPATLKAFAYNFISLDGAPGLGGDEGLFYAFGSDYYGALLPDTLRYLRPAGTGWNYLDLSADNITLYGDFFAGMFWDRWNSPMIGWDTNATNGLNLMYSDPGGYPDWYLSTGTFFVRAVVSYVNEVTGVAEDVMLSPTGFSLSQNYPNPFNPITKIRLTIADTRLTIVSVYDLLGREVATLVNEVKEPGTYEVQFDASGLASGVYLYRLTAGNHVESRKLMVVR